MGTAGGDPGAAPRLRPPSRRPARLPSLGPILGAEVTGGPDADGVYARELGRRDDGTGPGPLAIRPLVVDSNVLRDDVLAAVRRGHQTALMDASARSGLRLFCGPHVPAEVEEHLHRWAVKGRADPVVARAAWRDHHLPFLRCVDLPLSLLGATERARYDALATVDADDLPTVVLCLVADAPVLTRDGPLVEAVHGAGTDTAALTGFVEVALSGRRLSDDDETALGALVAGRLATIAVGGAAGLIRRMPRSVLVAATGVLAAMAWLDRTTVRVTTARTRTRIGPVAVAALETFGAWATSNREATAVLVGMLPPLRQDDPAELPSGTRDARAVVRALARANGPTSAAELAASAGLPVARARAALRETGAVVEVLRGRFQLGRPYPGSYA